MRSAILLRSAFSREIARAFFEMSVPVTTAFGSCDASATAIAPDPVPTSRMRMGEAGSLLSHPSCKEGRKDGAPERVARARHCSTRCSVSGRGIRHVGRDAKGQAVEFRFAGDVLDGLAFAAAFEQAGVADRAASGEIIVGVSHQPGFVFADQMKQQRLGVEARAVRMRAGAELGLSLARATRADVIRLPDRCRPSAARPGSGR